MKKNLFFVVSTLLTITVSAFAADWVQIDEKIYLDASSLSQYNYDLNFNHDKLYSIWVKSLNNGNESWKDLEKLTKRKLWYTINLKIINCTRKEISTKSSTDYDIKENVAYTHDYNYLNWQSIVPETIGENIYSFVCGANYSGAQYNFFNKNNNYIQSTNGTRIRVRSHR